MCRYATSPDGVNWNSPINPIGGGEAISGIGLAELRKDGFVSADATLLAANWQATAKGSSASVPEPDCVALLLAGLLTLLFRPR